MTKRTVTKAGKRADKALAKHGAGSGKYSKAYGKLRDAEHRENRRSERGY